ncbi:MAG: phosphohistidine phosphatase SixA [Nitrosomonas sp.]|nr:phosphohistidine phosphatase SixA [Nitrosomonas sp.]MCC7136317.1 phosphohistidine phosphatase SixA [Nitrosomonas sp.]
MDLILWRHAEAELGFPDESRKLTDNGLKQAKKMAQWLKSRIPENTRIVASPTKRTQQTAAALITSFETLPRIGPSAAPESVLTAVNWPYEENAVLIIGHQPTLGQIASLLYTGNDAGFSVRKGSIWWFSYKERNGRNNAILRAMMTPEMV